ncbi:MAG TPA: histidine phosphatase family protein [Prolixibacteraceae bacterium]|nr:histidine phosphatase family protein [Prolixibacteraceae bacterium]
MKRLILVRHAKSEQGGYDRDFSRSLTSLGEADAHRVAGDLKEWNIVPDKMISSPALRALTTAQIFAGELGYPSASIEEIPDLYFEMTSNEFVRLVQHTSPEVTNLFIFGHNPFMHYMAAHMCENFSGDMPTCSTVVIDYPVDSWKKALPGSGNFFLHLYPKLYQ